MQKCAVCVSLYTIEDQEVKRSGLRPWSSQRGGGVERWGHYLRVADMREKWNPLSDPNDVFLWSEKSKHVHCSVMWPKEGSQPGHCRKGLCFNYQGLKQHVRGKSVHTWTRRQRGDDSFQDADDIKFKKRKKNPETWRKPAARNKRNSACHQVQFHCV